MNSHKPKRIRSARGLGLGNTTKEIVRVSTSVAITHETWHEMPEPWTVNGVVIARPGYTWLSKWEEGRNFLMTKVIDDDGELAGLYCDICSPITRNSSGFEFFDWYLDVWQELGKAPVVLDEEVLVAAVAAGFISSADATTAREVAQALVAQLASNCYELDF